VYRPALPLSSEGILLLSADGTVLHAFGVISCEDELHGGKERGIELRLLIGDALTDAIANRNTAVLQLKDSYRNPIDVQHNIRSTRVVAADCHFLCDRKIVFGRLFPIDQLDRFSVLARFGLHRHPVT